MDTTRIIIGCLPRTGSTWLTALLNLNKDGIFFHDILANRHDYNKLFREKRKYTGFVGTDMMLPMFDVLTGKRFYLFRDRSEIAFSAAQYLEISGTEAERLVDECFYLGQTWCEKHEPEIIDYANIKKLDFIEDFLKKIFGTKPDMDKVIEFMRLNIQETAPCKELKNLLIP